MKNNFRLGAVVENRRPRFAPKEEPPERHEVYETKDKRRINSKDQIFFRILG